MISYSTRKGVLLTNICGEYLLVADREARRYCSYVRRVNDTAAFLWKRLEGCASETDLILALIKEYGISEGDAQSAVKGYLEQLDRNGYLLTEERYD